MQDPIKFLGDEALIDKEEERVKVFCDATGLTEEQAVQYMNTSRNITTDLAQLIDDFHPNKPIAGLLLSVIVTLRAMGKFRNEDLTMLFDILPHAIARADGLRGPHHG